MPGNKEINFGIPPWGGRCKQTENGWIVSATTRSCAAPFPIAFMSFWSYLAFGWMFSSRFSLKQLTPALAVIIIFFALAALFFWWVALMGVFGKEEVRLDGDDGQVFTGFGPFSRTRRFKWSETTAVGESSTRSSGNPEILIEGKKCIRFGSWLSNTRRQFMLQVLSRLLLP